MLIGSDGALELDEGTVAALEVDDAIAANPSLLTKRLQVAGPRWDDCSVALLRRAPGSTPCV